MTNSENPNPESPQTPSPMPSVRTPLIVGGILALVTIVLFVAIYSFLSTTSLEPFIRLLVSLCLPPAILSLILGAYVLMKQSKKG